jgi:hypothetical protein
MINEIEICDLSFAEIEFVGGGLADKCKLETVYTCDSAGNCTGSSAVVCRPE